MVEIVSSNDMNLGSLKRIHMVFKFLSTSLVIKTESTYAVNMDCEETLPLKIDCNFNTLNLCIYLFIYMFGLSILISNSLMDHT